MSQNLYIVDLEPIESRYTSEWRQFLPVQLQRHASQIGKSDLNIRVIDGGVTSGQTSTGGFFDFGETVQYKSAQIGKIAKFVREGQIIPGDRLFWMDAWHPGVIATRYMSDLLDLGLRQYGLFHAGSYDSHDILGQRISDKNWSMTFERSLLHALDQSFVATEFHRNLMRTQLELDDSYKIERAGLPMEYLKILLGADGCAKKDLVVFPHRLSQEKQPDFVRELADGMPNVEFRFCQEQALSKREYHQVLRQAKIVISASLQETTGIGVYEALLSGAIPVLPDRLSYSEMYDDRYLYPSEWTATAAQFHRYKYDLIDRLNFDLARHNDISKRLRFELESEAARIGEIFFDGRTLYEGVLK